jgi:hypothetical protein
LLPCYFPVAERHCTGSTLLPEDVRVISRRATDDAICVVTLVSLLDVSGAP